MVEIAARPMAAAAYQVFARGLGQFGWLAGGWLTCLLGCVVAKMLPWPDAVDALLVFVTVLVFAAGAASFSVAWYRAILLDEDAEGIIALTFDVQEIFYSFYQGAIALILAAPLALLCWLLRAEMLWVAALSFLGYGEPNGAAIALAFGGVAALLALSVASFWIAARLMLALAVVAVDDQPGRLLVEAWRLTRGNGAALFFGWLACIMPAAGVWGLASLLLLHALGDLARPIVELLAYLAAFVALAVTGAFYSLVFAQFGEGELAESQDTPLGALPAQ